MDGPPRFLPPQAPEWPPPATIEPPASPADEASVIRGRAGLPPFPVWSPFAAMLITLVVALIGFLLIQAIVEAAGTEVDPDNLPTGVTVGGTLIQDIALIVSAILIASVAATRPTP